MIVEAAICTWNRADLLQTTLQRLTEIKIPDNSEFRVIVVDNNSSDRTAETIENFQAKLNLISLKEQQQGHTYARNRAIEHASGDLLLWLDDDVRVSDSWLTSYIDAAKSETEVSFWGGPIEPKFIVQQPGWIDQNWDKLQGCFAARDLGDVAIDFREDCLPYGANFAIRTAAQKQFPFSSTLGRSGTAVVGEDELQVLRSMITSGLRGRWVPAAGVEHLIDPSRATTEYVRNYFIGQGRALVVKDAAWTSDVSQLRREADHELFWYRAKRWFTKSDVWLSHLIRASLAEGQHQELLADRNAKPNRNN